MASFQEQERSEYAWPSAKNRQIIGQRTTRIDGIYKTTGEAKFSSDLNPTDLLHGRLLTSPYAHARITKMNVDAAKKSKGVQGVYLFADAAVGSEIRWQGRELVAVAADTPEQAEDAIAAIEVEYEVLEHWVDEADVEGARAAGRANENEAQVAGDVDAGFAQADKIIEGHYGIPTITHCCWETHGSTCVWDGRSLTAYLSTQNVSGTPGQFTNGLTMKDVDIESTEVVCQYEGGGFGSKFAADTWGIAAAYLAHEAGRPVKLMLSRATELQIAGNRPSGYAEVKIGIKNDGKMVAWDSVHWGTSGVGGGGVSAGVTPYIFTPENTRRQQISISTNTGGARAWRAPNHPQGCALTQTAMEDAAAALGMDPIAFFKKNLDIVDRAQHPDAATVYAKELDIAADLIGWSQRWHPRGQGGGGAVKQGLGIAIHSWGGGAHPSSCMLKIRPDGGVETYLGSQDIGTGTKTIIAMAIGETLGLPADAIKVNVGRSSYPVSGGSGGSTTVGGVSGSNRKAAVEARKELFAKVAPRLNASADQLEARNGEIRVQGTDRKLSWTQATGLLGVQPIEVMQTHRGDEPGLTARGVGGVQIADVSVDTETGIVRMNKYVAVQDVGTIIDLLTAESQVHGAVIMGIAFALTEEQIMDNATGRFINSDMVNYKLPRLGDIGEIIVHMIQPEDGEVGRAEHDRGVVGLGEPPVISPGAAISNAVANAIGVRVPTLPMTPDRVLAALEKGGDA